jgi:hypothetical protein
MNPPPIPPEARNHQSNFHQAAIAALAAPLIGIVAGGVSQAIQQGQPANREVILAMGGFVVLMFFVGLGSSIVALCGISRYGKSRLLGFGLSGVIINGLLLFIFATNFVGARKAAIANQKGLQELRAATDEFRTNTVNAYNPTSGIAGDVQVKQMSDFRARLDTASKTVTGDDAQLFQALNVCMANWELAQKAFLKASGVFQAAGVLNFETLNQKEQVEQRLQIVQDYLKANETLRVSVVKQDADLEAELHSRAVPAAKLREFMNGFRASRAPIMVKVQQIRDCEKDAGNAILKILELTESQWGRWRYDTSRQTVVFEDHATQNEVARLGGLISSLSTKEIRLQGEMIDIQKKAAVARKN